MARGKRSFLASLFGFKTQCSGEKQEEQPQRYYQGTRVRPSDNDEYYGRHWYAERDINKRASEYIEKSLRILLGHLEFLDSTDNPSKLNGQVPTSWMEPTQDKVSPQHTYMYEKVGP
ncbi:hypothetical protein EJB05_30959, partial [Eragrostis curvula]